jgi:hypothetical protein
VADEENKCLLIPSFLDPVEEEDTIVFVVLVCILELVKLLFSIEVVFWRVVLVFFDHPRYICLVLSFNICVDVRRISIRVGLPYLILCIEAALEF